MLGTEPTYHHHKVIVKEHLHRILLIDLLAHDFLHGDMSYLGQDGKVNVTSKKSFLNASLVKAMALLTLLVRGFVQELQHTGILVHILQEHRLNLPISLYLETIEISKYINYVMTVMDGKMLYLLSHLFL